MLCEMYGVSLMRSLAYIPVKNAYIWHQIFSSTFYVILSSCLKHSETLFEKLRKKLAHIIFFFSHISHPLLSRQNKNMITIYLHNWDGQHKQTTILSSKNKLEPRRQFDHSYIYTLICNRDGQGINVNICRSHGQRMNINMNKQTTVCWSISRRQWPY